MNTTGVDADSVAMQTATVARLTAVRRGIAYVTVALAQTVTYLQCVHETKSLVNISFCTQITFACNIIFNFCKQIQLTYSFL